MMKLIAVFLISILITTCSNNEQKKGQIQDEVKGMTIEELVAGPDWELIDDSVLVEGMYCKHYRNKITNQNIMIAPE